MRRMPRLGAPYADVRRVPSAPCANQKARAVMGVRAALLTAGLQRSLRWAPALDGRMLLLATHDAADARALNISDIITL